MKDNYGDKIVVEPLLMEEGVHVAFHGGEDGYMDMALSPAKARKLIRKIGEALNG